MAAEVFAYYRIRNQFYIILHYNYFTTIIIMISDARTEHSYFLASNAIPASQ